MERIYRVVSFAFKQNKGKKIVKSSIKKLSYAFFLLFTFFISPSNAELIILGKIGKTVPASLYYKNVNVNVKDVKIDTNKATGLMASAKKSISDEIFFPLISKKMKKIPG